MGRGSVEQPSATSLSHTGVWFRAGHRSGLPCGSGFSCQTYQVTVPKPTVLVRSWTKQSAICKQDGRTAGLSTESESGGEVANST
jgi:hypothetical protein